MSQLLSHLRVDTGMAFIVVQHLDPHRGSALAELLARVTKMPVGEVAKRTTLAPNHVYVIPPGSDISFSKGALTLRARPLTRAPHLSVDFLFNSLAQDQHERAIGVILSGNATDGTLGLEAIKAEGGITFAQDDSAKYDSMPRSAIAAGCVDFVLSPEKIAAELGRIATHPYLRGQNSALFEAAAVSGRRLAAKDGKGGPPAAKAEEKPDADFAKILSLLQNHSRADFTHYRPNTIQRRITRRMALGKFEAVSSYSRFLASNPKERDALFGDLLIGVTSFFRNPEAFDTLRKKVLPRLFKHRRDDPIRVWTLGCSTGQEAYSIAMLMVEYAENMTGGSVPIQVYATDLNDAALNKARQGLYPKNLLADLSPERLRRFFVEEHGGYRVNKMLREMCIFARHNLLADPPFSRMDLVTCRNLLIYIEPALQKQILPSFHYALKADGFLFLGASESVGSFTGLFEPVDKKEKIYQRKAVETPPHQSRAATPRPGAKIPATPRPPAASNGTSTELSAQREADRIALKQYAPPAVLINERLQVLQFRGATGRYLEPASGKATFNLLQMAREGLMLPLRMALHRAKKNNRKVTQASFQFRQNGSTRALTLEITPLHQLAGICYLVAFKEARHRRVDTPEPLATGNRDGSPEARNGSTGSQALRRETRRAADLERELSETRDYLQSLQEQHEASNEEIQASHEEGQSANEELQSINEELETSKEELESSNEELITLNEEMLTRNADLNRLNSDLNNLHLSINTAILVLGRDLRIRRFTPAAEKIFNLVATDLGRPIGGIRSAINFLGLEPFVLEVIESDSMREREVQDTTGHWYLLRVRPYLTLDNEIDGAVLVLIDIDALKQSEEAVARARDYSEAILRTARDAMMVLSADLRVSQANEAFYRLFQNTPEVTEGTSLYKLDRRRWDDVRLRTVMASMVLTGVAFNDFETETDIPGQGRRTLLLHGRRMEGDDQNGSRSFLLSIEDITGRLESRAALQVSETRFRRLFETARDGILLVDPTTRKIVDANPSITKLLGYGYDELVGRELNQIGLVKDAAASRDTFRELREHGFIRNEDLALVTKAGERRDVELMGNLYVEDGTEIAQCNIRDVTARKETAELLVEQDRFIFSLIEQSPVGTFVVDAELKVLQINARALVTLGHLGPIVGRYYPDICHEFWGPLAAADVVRLFHLTLETGEPFVSPEYAGERVDGETEEIFEWQLQRIVRTDGRRCVVSYFNDVTERVRSKARLEAQARWADLLSSITAQLTLASAPSATLGTILNQVASEFGGAILLNYSVSRDCRRLTLEHAVGLPASQREALAELRVHEGLGASPDTPDQQVGMSDVVGDPHPNFETLRAMGAKVFFSYPLRAGSNLLGILVIVSLVRSRFSREEVKFIKTVCDLAAATEERLRLFKDTAKARDVAQAANQAKDDFLGAVSHELRTPLNPVLLVSSERAEDDTLAGDVRADFETIARNAALEARLIDDLLDLTRAAHAKLALQVSDVDVHAVMADAIAILQPEFLKKKIELTVATRSSNSIVRGDGLRLQQVFWNVLRNAVKFTAEGGKISVVTELSVNRARLHVSVTDNGIGMTPEELTRVFDRFAQGDHANAGGSVRFGGLGLGLAISRMLVEAHAGTIEASSAGRDQGTTFLIDIPVSTETDGTVVPTKARRTGTVPATRPKRRRLLIVEDHDATRLALVGLLKRRGYAVIPAVSVGEARSLAGQQEFDVIVCDIGLPDGTGYELMADLAKVGTIKGIALTGFGSQADIARSLAAGFSSHVTKPVSIQALAQALDALERE